LPPPTWLLPHEGEEMIIKMIPEAVKNCGAMLSKPRGGLLLSKSAGLMSSNEAD
jgi:hypothetical protein